MSNNSQSKNARLINNSIIKIKKYKGLTLSTPEPIVTWEGAPLIYPNTINIIQGQSGVHKSRLAELIVRSILSKEADYSNSLNLKGNNGLALCYLDTERNIKYQFSKSIGDIERACGFTGKEKVEHFHFASFIQINRKERLIALQDYLKEIRKTEGDRQLVVVIDVISDFVQNFNDPEESMELIDFLNTMIQENNCTIVALIHENPYNPAYSGNSGKGRGHLGTELTNKSSLVLSLSFVKGSYSEIKIAFKKARGFMRCPMKYARYDNFKHTLVLVAKDETSISLDVEAKVLTAISQLFSDETSKKFTSSEFWEKIRMLSGESRRKCGELVPKVIKAKLGISIGEDKFYLKSDKTGNRIEYSLVSSFKEFKQPGPSHNES